MDCQVLNDQRPPLRSSLHTVPSHIPAERTYPFNSIPSLCNLLSPWRRWQSRQRSAKHASVMRSRKTLSVTIQEEGPSKWAAFTAITNFRTRLSAPIHRPKEETFSLILVKWVFKISRRPCTRDFPRHRLLCSIKAPSIGVWTTETVWRPVVLLYRPQSVRPESQCQRSPPRPQATCNACAQLTRTLSSGAICTKWLKSLTE